MARKQAGKVGRKTVRGGAGAGRKAARAGFPWLPVVAVAGVVVVGFALTRTPTAPGPAIPAAQPVTPAAAPAPRRAPAPAPAKSVRPPAAESVPKPVTPAAAPVAATPPAAQPAPVVLKAAPPADAPVQPVANVSHPAPVAALPPGSLALAQAKASFDAGQAVFVDVRLPNGFVFGHVPGAVNLPAAQFADAFAQKGAGINRGLQVIVYGAAANSPEARQVAGELGKHGLANVVNLAEGFAGWEAAGYPKQRGFGTTP